MGPIRQFMAHFGGLAILQATFTFVWSQNSIEPSYKPIQKEEFECWCKWDPITWYVPKRSRTAINHGIGNPKKGSVNRQSRVRIEKFLLCMKNCLNNCSNLILNKSKRRPPPSQKVWNETSVIPCHLNSADSSSYKYEMTHINTPIIPLTV